MGQPPIKRLRYFTGQFLEATDFESEQAYHIEMRQRGNRVLYTEAGVLDSGLQVTPGDNETEIVISPGTGVDDLGRELVLVDALTMTLPTTPAYESEYWVTLEYAATSTDVQPPDGGAVSDATRFEETPTVGGAVSDATRFEETPSVQFPPTNQRPGPHALSLAKDGVGGGKLVGQVDSSPRQRANGAFIGNLTIGQGGDGKLFTRHIEGKGGDSDIADDLFLNWSNGKNVRVGGGNLKSSLLVSDRLGVGTLSPRAALEVAGGAIMPAAGISDTAGIRFADDFGEEATGDSAWIRYARLSDGAFLEIGTSNEVICDIDLLPAGEVFIGSTLHVEGNTKLEGATGVGTTNPGATLTIRTPEDYSGDTLRFETKREPESNLLNLRTRYTTGNVRWVFDHKNAGVDYPSVLSFDEGKVGIGTDDPKSKLHINGDTRLDGNLFFGPSAVATTNDGFKNVLTPKNVVKAWGVVRTAGGSNSILLDGFNVQSITFTRADTAVITLKEVITGPVCITGSVKSSPPTRAFLNFDCYPDRIDVVGTEIFGDASAAISGVTANMHLMRWSDGYEFSFIVMGSQ